MRGRLLEAGAADRDNDETPSLEAYLDAFRLEDEEDTTPPIPSVILFAKACLVGALPTQIMPPACLMGPSEPGVYLNSFTM